MAKPPQVLHLRSLNFDWSALGAGKGSDPLPFNHAGRSQLYHAIPEPGGHARNRRDTEGHSVVPVRDREAPGSNPGPRPKIVFKSRSSPAPSSARGSQGGHGFSRNSAAAGPRSSGLRPSIELAHGDRTADISACARPGTVRHLGSKIKGALHAVCSRRTSQDREAMSPTQGRR